MIDAAKIADLNLLGFINENSAAAIFYAIDKKIET
jgi:molecular chaperone DnaK (HSP70)